MVHDTSEDDDRVAIRSSIDRKTSVIASLNNYDASLTEIKQRNKTS